MANKTLPKYKLPDFFRQTPETATVKITTAQWESLILKWIIVKGVVWTIEHRLLGPDVIEVYLKEKKARKSADKLIEMKMALNHMVSEYEKASGIDRKTLPAFVMKHLK